MLYIIKVDGTATVIEADEESVVQDYCRLRTLQIINDNPWYYTNGKKPLVQYRVVNPIQRVTSSVVAEYINRAEACSEDLRKRYPLLTQG